MINLQHNQVILRALEPSDLELIYQWENDPEHWFVSNTRTPYSREIISKYLDAAHLDIYQTKQLRLMIELKDQASGTEGAVPVGTIDLFDFDPFHLRAGVGILIARKEFRSKGYASDALEAFKSYAFDALGLHQLYCNIAVDNTHSIRLFEKSGFVVSGTKKEWLRDAGGWVDELLLQCLATE